MEDSNDIAQFLQCCLRHGIEFSRVPPFTNQGPLLATVKELGKHGFKTNIMICTMHFIHTVCWHHPDFFDNNSNNSGSNIVERTINDACEVPLLEPFFAASKEMLKKLLVPHPDQIDDTVTMTKCTLNFHPSHWMTPGDAQGFEEDNCQRAHVEFFAEPILAQCMKNTPNKIVQCNNEECNETICIADDHGTTEGSASVLPEK